MRLATLLTLFLATAAAAVADTYRWVDANGVTVYSQTPPPGRPAQRIRIHTPPPSDPDQAHRRLESQRLYLQDRREDRELARRARQKRKEERQRRAANCRAAKKNLESLQVNVRRLYKDPEGGYRRLTEAERREMIAAARRQIEENCDQ